MQLTIFLALIALSAAFSPAFVTRYYSKTLRESSHSTILRAAADDKVSCKITVSGEVQGGYYRASIKNEAVNFRSLTGTLQELETGDTVITAEGPKKALEGFIRWCGKSPGLTQTVEVKDTEWGDASGLEGWEMTDLK